jgi:hypothetical protein
VQDTRAMRTTDRTRMLTNKTRSAFRTAIDRDCSCRLPNTVCRMLLLYSIIVIIIVYNYRINKCVNCYRCIVVTSPSWRPISKYRKECLRAEQHKQQPHDTAYCMKSIEIQRRTGNTESITY